MKKSIKISVLKKHITCGRRYSPQACPIAKAITDAGLKTAQVGADDVSFGYNRKRYHSVDLPKPASTFIRKFDDKETNRSKLKPFRFQLKFEVKKSKSKVKV